LVSVAVGLFEELDAEVVELDAEVVELDAEAPVQAAWAAARSVAAVVELAVVVEVVVQVVEPALASLHVVHGARQLASRNRQGCQPSLSILFSESTNDY
jgi:hypothetical protein